MGWDKAFSKTLFAVMDAKMFEDHSPESQAPLLAPHPTKSSLCLLAWETTPSCRQQRQRCPTTSGRRHSGITCKPLHFLEDGQEQTAMFAGIWQNSPSAKKKKQMATMPEQIAYLNRLIKAIKRHNPYRNCTHRILMLPSWTDQAKFLQKAFSNVPQEPSVTNAVLSQREAWGCMRQLGIFL